MNKRFSVVFLLIFAFAIIMPAVSANTTAVTATETYKNVERLDGDVFSTLYHENIHLTQNPDGSYVYIVHVVSDFDIRFADGSRYTERYNEKTVTITADGDYKVINGFYTERFESFGYVALFHSEYTYSNGEIRVNHYWEKVTE